MAEKLQTTCKKCEKTRFVTEQMVKNIENGIGLGLCRSCAMTGNKHRYNDVYSKELFNSRIYKIWSCMKYRCDKKGATGYKRYGGRGITYQKSWVNFSNFYKDMAEGYKENLTLERIDNNGNYCKENCRWATFIDQANNRSTSKRITFQGETKTLSQWASHLGLKSSTVRQRIYVYKWPIEKAFNYQQS